MWYGEEYDEDFTPKTIEYHCLACDVKGAVPFGEDPICWMCDKEAKRILSLYYPVLW
jgi:hypothetical protein